MDQLPPKPSKEQVWRNMTYFWEDGSLDDEYEACINDIADRLAQQGPISTLDELRSFICTSLVNVNGPLITRAFRNNLPLNIVLAYLGISVEKLKRVVTNLRIISGEFALERDKEWSLGRIRREIVQNTPWGSRIIALLWNGAEDSSLKLPKFDKQLFNLKDIGLDFSSSEFIKSRVRSVFATPYYTRRGKLLEEATKSQLTQLGVPFEEKKEVYRRDVDFVLPSAHDPRVIIECSYMETTSSGQTTKMERMAQLYTDIRQQNLRDRKRRVFINVVGGIGWIARERDLGRLYEACDYMLTARSLTMLQQIIPRVLNE